MSDFKSRYFVPTFDGLVAQIGLSAGISIVCVGFFEWNRRKKTMAYLYSPRCRLKENPSPPMSTKFLGWIIPTLRLSDEFYINNVGLDAVMFLRFLKMCLQFCLFNAIVVGTILLPIHYYGGGGQSEVLRLSVANIENDSNILWTHVFMAYVVTGSWMFLLFKNYWQWMDLRREYTLYRIHQGEIAERSVFVSRLPSSLRTDVALKEYFESLKMGPVESATVVQHCGRLAQKIDRRESALNQLEKAHIELARDVAESVKTGRFLQEATSATSYSHSSEVASDETRLRPPPAKDGSGDRQGHDITIHIEDTTSSSSPVTALNTQVSELFKSRRIYNKTRKSIFAHKRVLDRPAPAPTLNVPLSALAHHSDVIDVYVNSNEKATDKTAHATAEAGASSLSLALAVPNTIWHTLSKLDRFWLDPFQPKRQSKRFKGGDRIEAIDHFVAKYNKLDRKVGELRDGSPRYKPTSFGFVTFKNHLSAQLCAQSKTDSRPQGLSVELAMEPRDVLWSNLTASFRNRFTRSIAVNLGVWAMTIFWIFPTSSFLFLTSLAALSEKFAFLRPLLDSSPLMQSLLQNVLPIVFVTIFLAFAPVLIQEISKQELPVSHSALEENVLHRYYKFLIFNVLFVFMIGTAILKSIIALLQTPTNIFTQLAESLPLGSTFFIFYITFNTCTHALELVQIWAQLIVHVFVTARKMTPTPRAQQRATTPWTFQYYYYYPHCILAIVITFIYSLINPLVLWAAVAHFAFAVLVFKYQLAYCYIRKYEMSGKFFKIVFRYTTDGLIIFQIMMVGVLWLKKALVGGFLVMVLIGWTAYFKILCRRLFHSRTKYLPLDTGLRNFDREIMVDHAPTPMEDASLQSSFVNLQSELQRAHTTGAGVRSLGQAVIGVGSMASQISMGPLYKNHQRLDGKDGHRDDDILILDHQNSNGGLRHRMSQSDRYERLDSSSHGTDDTLHRPHLARATTAPLGAFENTSMYGLGLTVPATDTLSLDERQRGSVTFVNNDADADDDDDDDGSAKDSSSPPAPVTAVDGDYPEPVESSDVIDKGSTQDIRLFSVEGHHPPRPPHPSRPSLSEVVHPGILKSSRLDDDYENFIDETGIFTEKHLVRRPTMACRPLASHFEHVPSKVIYQDRTSEFETYLHPALLKPLSRKLWLPQNPLYHHWDLDDTCEIDFAINSTSTVNKLEFRVREPQPLDDDVTGGRRSFQSQRRMRGRRNTTNTFHEVSLPSNWQGCLHDSPPATPMSPKASGVQEYVVDGDIAASGCASEGVLSKDSRILERRGSRDHQGYLSRPPLHHLHVPDRGSDIPYSPSITGIQRAKTTIVEPRRSSSAADRAPKDGGPSTSTFTGPGDASDIAAGGVATGLTAKSPLSNATRYRRSTSMPPAPGSLGSNPSTPSSPMSPLMAMSPPSNYLKVYPPLHAGGHSSPSSGGGMSPSPRVSFVQDGGHGGSGSATNTMHRTAGMTMPMMMMAGSGPGNGGGAIMLTPGAMRSSIFSNSRTSNLVPTPLSPSAPPTAAKKNIGAGDIFNMIFGDPEEDDDDAGTGGGTSRGDGRQGGAGSRNNKPLFGYETVGAWSRRRGSRDVHDDDDDDDDEESDLVTEEEDEEEEEDGSSIRGQQDNEQAMALAALRLSPPSHLDLSDPGQPRDLGSRH
ncbi:hypothetical protein DFQ26_006920 [Actinomortierella ambigua]|nr:hypothetical protein DFQ26_006920 [Actinomortierella ambigua]